MEKLSRLPRGRDGYGASKVDSNEVLRVIRTFSAVLNRSPPARSVVPFPGGGVQVEWHRRGKHLVWAS